MDITNLKQEQLLGILKSLDHFETVPVGIDTFLDDPRYLGGYFGEKSIQPYWRNLLKKIYPSPFESSNYWLICLRGSIGQGKTTISCVGLAYDIHRLLCLTSPQSSFSLLPDTAILFAIFNVTLSLAQDVVWQTLSSMFSRSPYFSELLGKIKNKPQGAPIFPKNIGIFMGSRLSHTLGKAVYSCLTGDTLIPTPNGEIPLKDLVTNYKGIKVYSFDIKLKRRVLGNVTFGAHTGKKEVWRVYLSNGLFFDATSDHKFLMYDYTYKQAFELEHLDEFLSQSVDLDHSPILMIGRDLLGEMDVYDISVDNYNNFAIGPGVFAHNCLWDEASFEILHGQVYESFLSILRRMESRFSSNSPVGTGKVWVVSSEAEKNTTMNRIINSYSGKGGVLVSQQPLWNVYPERYKDERFLVFIGVDNRAPEIIREENTDIILMHPEKIIEVPEEHRNSFEADLYSALRDLGGVEIGGGQLLFRLKEKLTSMLTGPNYFPDVITLDFDNDSQIQDDCNLPRFFDTTPRCIHIDTALSGDKLGISASYIKEFVLKETFDNKYMVNVKEYKPKIVVDFAFAVGACKGKQIPLFKIRQFIAWLTTIGYPIHAITADSYNSADLLQQLTKVGYKTAVVSLDRTPDGYLSLRNLVYEGDCLMPSNKLLKKELEQLELSNNKVDHPTVVDGHPGSKDIADAVAGSVFMCVKDSEHFQAMRLTEDFADRYMQSIEMDKEDIKDKFWPEYKNKKETYEY